MQFYTPFPLSPTWMSNWDKIVNGLFRIKDCYVFYFINKPINMKLFYDSHLQMNYV